jgi:hypothetical protein
MKKDINKKKIIGILSEKEKELIPIFLKHQKKLKLLEKAGVFEIKDGSATIHFDKFGEIGLISITKYFRFPPENPQPDPLVLVKE